MRVLTTAIDKGEHKVPEGHKCTLYALAPGKALEMDDDTRETKVVTVTDKEAKIAKYLYLLRWVEGRTVAEFDVNGRLLVQPTSPDPIPKKKRGERDSTADDAEGEGQGAPEEVADHPRLPVQETREAPRRRREVLDLSGAEEPAKRRTRRPRWKPPPDLL